MPYICPGLRYFNFMFSLSALVSYHLNISKYKWLEHIEIHKYDMFIMLWNQNPILSSEIEEKTQQNNPRGIVKWYCTFRILIFYDITLFATAKQCILFRIMQL